MFEKSSNLTWCQRPDPIVLPLEVPDLLDLGEADHDQEHDQQLCQRGEVNLQRNREHSVNHNNIKQRPMLTLRRCVFLFLMDSLVSAVSPSLTSSLTSSSWPRLWLRDTEALTAVIGGITGKFWTAVVSRCLIGGSNPEKFIVTFIIIDCFMFSITWPSLPLGGSSPVVGQSVEHDLTLSDIIIVMRGPWCHHILKFELYCSLGLLMDHTALALGSLDTILMRRKLWTLKFRISRSQ